MKVLKTRDHKSPFNRTKRKPFMNIIAIRLLPSRLSSNSNEGGFIRAMCVIIRRFYSSLSCVCLCVHVSIFLCNVIHNFLSIRNSPFLEPYLYFLPFPTISFWLWPLPAKKCYGFRITTLTKHLHYFLKALFTYILYLRK